MTATVTPSITGMGKTQLRMRRHNYGVLMYYERKAERALSEGNMLEHREWGEKYHNLLAQLEPST